MIEETVEEIMGKVEKASNEFEKNNTEIKRKYLIWNIESFNLIASNVSVSKGSFGTGYPFYVLDGNLNGKIPIIAEQIRYNRQLILDGVQIQKSIWKCKSCLKEKSQDMPDLKTICKPCPNMIKELKPRKIINRLPDLDMWLVCEDGKIEQAEKELTVLLKKNNMRTSDVDPIYSIDEVYKISKIIKEGKVPKKYLPIDIHIIEYSKIKDLLDRVPEELRISKENEESPYLPIQPKSYRKKWQYDDEAYNFIYDFLSAFTPFNFEDKLQESVESSRKKVLEDNTDNELFDFLLKSATSANFKRFQTVELKEIFENRMAQWRDNLCEKQKKNGDKSNER